MFVVCSVGSNATAGGCNWVLLIVVMVVSAVGVGAGAGTVDQT